MRVARAIGSLACWVVLGFGTGCAGLGSWVTTPSSGFEALAAPPPPDYALRSSWAALPGESDPPAGGADVFFLHPTTYFWRGGWNGSADGWLTRIITDASLKGQASAFAPAGRPLTRLSARSGAMIPVTHAQ